ncbi:RAMP superfamily CRISPR-associated protein [Pseudoalteromonas gelatinilytica]
MSQVFVSKLVLETQSPMAINSGAQVLGFDSELIRDASGLPYIPATAIAGVWGHLIAQNMGDDIRDKWFGSTKQSSSLVISNGVLHDAENRPVPPLTNPEQVAKDKLLSFLSDQRPHHRERVAINDRGVACSENNAKFDQILLPKGLRFSITLKWHTRPRADQVKLDESQWQDMLALWQDRKMAFGSNTRNGLGRIAVIACEQHCFDLSEGPQVGSALQTCLANHSVNGNALPELTKTNTVLLAKLPLQALDNWRCGSGAQLLSEQGGEHNVASISYSEPAVEWHNHKASVCPKRAVLCGSSIKGIIKHRIAYHLHRHLKKWAHTLSDAEHKEWQQQPKMLEQLFGFASDDGSGVAGQLYVDDAAITNYTAHIRTHNKIDRFTGGVQKGALFSEELLHQPQFTLTLWADKNLKLEQELVLAIQDTLNDLKNGLLPLGSGRNSSLVHPQTEKPWIDHTNNLIANQETSEAQ